MYRWSLTQIIKLLIWILNEDQTLVSLSNSITTHRSINYVLDNIMSNFCFFNACNDEVGGASLFFSNVLVLLSDFSSSSFSPCPSLVEGVDSSAFLAAFIFQNTQPDLQLSFNRVVWGSNFLFAWNFCAKSKPTTTRGMLLPASYDEQKKIYGRVRMNTLT